MDEELTHLVAELAVERCTPATLLLLLDRYAVASPAECEQIRAYTTRRRIYDGYRQLDLGFRERPTAEWVQRTLAKISITDGYPDPRDDWVAIDYLRRNVRDGALDLDAAVSAMAARSTARVALLLGGRLDQTLWQTQS